MHAQTIPQADITHQVLRYAAQLARTAYPSVPDQLRIGRAMDLLMAGHVTLNADGSAEVQSMEGVAVYHVNGKCQCMDRAQDGRCKHRFAVSLLKRTHAILKAARYAWYHGAEEGIAFPSKDGQAVEFLADSAVSSIRCQPADVVVACRVQEPR